MANLRVSVDNYNKEKRTTITWVDQRKYNLFNLEAKANISLVSY